MVVGSVHINSMRAVSGRARCRVHCTAGGPQFLGGLVDIRGKPSERKREMMSWMDFGVCVGASSHDTRMRIFEVQCFRSFDLAEKPP